MDGNIDKRFKAEKQVRNRVDKYKSLRKKKRKGFNCTRQPKEQSSTNNDTTTNESVSTAADNISLTQSQSKSTTPTLTTTTSTSSSNVSVILSNKADKPACQSSTNDISTNDNNDLTIVAHDIDVPQSRNESVPPTTTTTSTAPSKAAVMISKQGNKPAFSPLKQYDTST